MGNQGLKQRCLYNALLLCCCAALLLLDAKISCTKLISDVCQTGEGVRQRRRRRGAGAGGHSCRYIQKCETAVAPRETERGRSAKHVAFHIYNFFFFLFLHNTLNIFVCVCGYLYQRYLQDTGSTNLLICPTTMVTLPTTTTTTHVYFLGSFIFPSILLLRERPKCGDIFLESDEHMFLKYQNFSMCLNVEK